ncbi:MAG: hypothetical protein M1820_008750 [Bogoriella megaspora]|nr:MAG: hypothetical protein M1820_008750 [Bogoriella megaspora]
MSWIAVVKAARPAPMSPGNLYECEGVNGDLSSAWYRRSEVESAVRDAYTRLISHDQDDHTPAGAANNIEYPRDFDEDPHNHNPSVQPHCVGRPLKQFPILSSGLFVSGTNAGLDRVILRADTHQFCAIVTGRGEHNNRFHNCRPQPTYDPKDSAGVRESQKKHYDPIRPISMVRH